MPEIETDYLVVGAGASGMAFADALIAASDAEVVMVDRRHRPGGHWNDDYPFVRLHQPSALYGVASRALHEACGFRFVGVEREVGRKFNRWLDIALMQCLLHERPR